MSTTKIVIICLCLLMAIFFIGLSLNLIPKSNQGLENASEQEQQSSASEFSKDSWMNSLDSVLAPFASAVSNNEIKLKNCTKKSHGFILNEQATTCTINIAGFESAFKKLTLIPSRAAKLKINYQPAIGDNDEYDWPSPGQDTSSIKFIIIGKDGLSAQHSSTIKLQCEDCTDQRNVILRFESGNNS